MIRELMSRLLRADLEPRVDWSAVDSLEILARQSVELPLPWSRTETIEQVLGVSGNQLVLLKRWQSGGQRTRTCLSRTLDGRRMKLAEWLPGPQPVYRLKLPPVDAESVTFEESQPTWIRLWRNETILDMGAGICFFDSTDRELLQELRLLLLDGVVPESVQREEELQQRMSSLSEEDRRAAFAALILQQHTALDQQFLEAHPNLGPPPEILQPALDSLQQRFQEIERTAAARPVNPELAELMQQVVADTASQAVSPGEPADQGVRDRPDE